MRVQVFATEARLEIAYNEYVRAGYLYDETRSIEAINTHNTPCIVMVRGETVVLLRLDDKQRGEVWIDVE